MLGPGIDGKDCKFIPITKIPILVLKQNGKPWDVLFGRVKKKGLKYMLFTREAQSTTDYSTYIKRVEGKSIEDVGVIGIGVLGEGKAVSSFCGDLPLMR